jgi:hypothetical protein
MPTNTLTLPSGEKISVECDSRHPAVCEVIEISTVMDWCNHDTILRKVSLPPFWEGYGLLLLLLLLLVVVVVVVVVVAVKASWNVMGHAQETRFRLSAKRTSPFKLAGASVQSTTGSRGVRISGSNAGYSMFRGSVKDTGYPLHSPVSPSLPLPCVTVCHHISTGI